MAYLVAIKKFTLVHSSAVSRAVNGPFLPVKTSVVTNRHFAIMGIRLTTRPSCICARYQIASIPLRGLIVVIICDDIWLRFIPRREVLSSEVRRKEERRKGVIRK